MRQERYFKKKLFTNNNDDEKYKWKNLKEN